MTRSNFANRVLKTIIALALPSLCSISQASTLQLEGGSTRSAFNYVQIPDEDENRINLPDVTGLSYRLTGMIDITDSGMLYFLYAPLTVGYTTRDNSAFEFDGTDFLGNTETDISYKFNSYRLGYLWSFGGKSFKYWGGFVGKIRDAEIIVEQGDTDESFSNVGFVPLLGAGFLWSPSDWWSVYFHADGSYAPQGSAYDAVLELRGNLSDSFAVASGYRILGGGADNDTLENFAQFETVTLSLVYYFGN
ncbi:MAG: hypothetical protein HRT45_18440 [Bdellovibrionales bacterium]|nr:hypothetical protein [Bdellovibrionales bacterium]